MRTLAEEIVKASQDERLVYCKFGKQYVSNLEKQLNSIIGNSTTVCTSLRSATYLINIKKLIKEHNIESDNFGKLKTKTNISKTSEGPPMQYY